MSDISNADLLNIEQAINKAEAEEQDANVAAKKYYYAETAINELKYWRNHAKELVAALKKQRGL